MPLLDSFLLGSFNSLTRVPVKRDLLWGGSRRWRRRVELITLGRAVRLSYSKQFQAWLACDRFLDSPVRNQPDERHDDIEAASNPWFRECERNGCRVKSD